jgi:hypothetical protein
MKRKRLRSPDTTNDLNRFFQRFLSLWDRRVREPKLCELFGIPPVAKAENDPATGEVVQVGGQPRIQNWGAIARAKHDRAQANGGCLDGQHAEMEPGIWRVRGVITNEKGVQAQ